MKQLLPGRQAVLHVFIMFVCDFSQLRRHVVKGYTEEISLLFAARAAAAGGFQ